MGLVAALMLYTLTEESNFMHKLYSWITVPPEIVAKKKKKKHFPVTHCSQGWGAERGLVWCQLMGFRARRELPQLRSSAASPVGLALLSRQRA